jgi:hypothetical protein
MRKGEFVNRVADDVKLLLSISAFSFSAFCGERALAY